MTNVSDNNIFNILETNFDVLSNREIINAPNYFDHVNIIKYDELEINNLSIEKICVQVIDDIIKLIEQND
jgi:hypothetical protein